jgi:hypothetical protein
MGWYRPTSKIAWRGFAWLLSKVHPDLDVYGMFCAAGPGQYRAYPEALEIIENYYGYACCGEPPGGKYSAAIYRASYRIAGVTATWFLTTFVLAR